MNTEQDEFVFSQLADGELESDRLNEVLLGALDDEQARAKLKEMLRLRRATRDWRRSQPSRPVVIVAQRSGRPRRHRLPWRLSSMAVAACMGGLLVLTGFWAAGRLGNSGGPLVRPGPGMEPAALTSVTPEQMRQVAKVFAMHESVAGPLAWYAADDQNIKLASARGTEASGKPIAVLLRIVPASPDGTARTYVIVCREGEASAIELPSDSPQAPGMKVYLTPQSVNGSIEMQYAFATPLRQGQMVAAALSGQRKVGLTQTPLGQLAMGERMLNVQAAAWAMPREGN